MISDLMKNRVNALQYARDVLADHGYPSLASQVEEAMCEIAEEAEQGPTC